MVAADGRLLRMRVMADLMVEDLDPFALDPDTGLAADLKFLATPTIAPMAAPAAGPMTPTTRDEQG